MEVNKIVLEDGDGDVVVIAVEGEHDLYTAPALREKLDAVIEQKQAVVVDLTPATFVDSSILGVLLGARRRAHESGLGFAVQLGEQVEPGVRRILEVTGLIPVLPVKDDRAQALEAARSGPAPA